MSKCLSFCIYLIGNENSKLLYTLSRWDWRISDNNKNNFLFHSTFIHRERENRHFGLPGSARP